MQASPNMRTKKTSVNDTFFALDAKNVAKTMLHALKQLISLAIILALSLYLYAHWHLLQATLTLSWIHVFLLTGCIFLTWVVNSLQILLLLRMENIRIGFWENFMLQAMMILANYLPMRMGTLLRFQYFKKVHQVEFLRLGGIFGLRLAILLCASSLLALLALSKLNVLGSFNDYLLVLAFFGIFALGMALFFTWIKKSGQPENWLSKSLGIFFSAFVTIRKKPELALMLLFLLCLQLLILGIRLYISFDAVNEKVSFWGILLIVPVTTLILFLSITPGNLAIREWLIGWLSTLAGFDFSKAVFAGSLDRAVLIVCTFIVGSIGFVYVWSRVNRRR